MNAEILDQPRQTGAIPQVPRRITVDEFHCILDAGLFGPAPRLELVEGMIVNKMIKSPPRNLACDLIQELMARLLPPGYFASMSTSLTLAERDSELEPDVTILRGRHRDYTNRLRVSADVVLVIEVSDHNYRYDRSDKWAADAGSGIPIYWIIDLDNGRLEIHSLPTGSGDHAGYQHLEIREPDEETGVLLDGREVGRFFTRDLLP